MESSGILDFFTLEASACIERLDGIVAQAGGSAPSSDALFNDARTLRGSATMARQAPIAEVAAGIERIAKSLRDGGLSWNDGLRGVIIAAIDDLKVLVRNVRAWSAADDQRAAARRDEMDRVAPARPRRSAELQSSGASTAFIANEFAQIAVALDAAEGAAGSRPMLDVLPRVRALRGMAALRDIPPSADVLAAVEDAARPVETGQSIPNDARPVLRAAAGFLRQAASDLRAGSRPDAEGDAARRFAEALERLAPTAPAAGAVVPVSSLFHDDAGPHVINASPHPPTTSEQRFRMEVVSQAEHLGSVVREARTVVGQTERARATRNLTTAIAGLRATAESFGQRAVADFLAGHRTTAETLDPIALRALGEAATLLSDPKGDPDILSTRLGELAVGRVVDSAIGAGLSPTSSPTPSSVAVTEARLTEVLGAAASRAAEALSKMEEPSERASEAQTPSEEKRGAGLRELLASGLAGFSSLARQPLATPAFIEDDLPSIDDFAYRGRAALERARELRDEFRKRDNPPDTDELAELFDLLDLAAAE